MSEIRRPSHQDGFENSKGKEELGFLCDHSNPFGDIRSIHPLHGSKFEKNLSLLGRKKTIEDLQESGFPGSIRSDHPNKLSLLHPKRDILEHPIFMITKGDEIDFDHNVLIAFLVLKR